MFDAPVEWGIGHVLDAHGVEMDVDGDRPVGLACEAGVHVRAAVDDLVDRHVGAEAVGPIGEPRRHGPLTFVPRLRTGLERIHARDANELAHALGDRGGVDDFGSGHRQP